MIRYFAFLRGINVGGKNLIKMNELRQLFESLGLSRVKTFIQSGNVIFDSSEVNVLKLIKMSENSLNQFFGKEVPVVIRTEDEMNEMI